MNRPHDLWKRVQIGGSSECWPWTGARSSNGYGVFSLGGRDAGTHRLALELATGQKPGDLMVLHTCDNPPCCNPAHLYVGTGADNQRDAVARNRRPSRRGSLHPLAKLTEEKVRQIRSRHREGARGSDLAREYGVDPSQITRIVRHPDRDWSHA